MRLLIQNGRLICPDQGLDRVMSVLVEDGRIVSLDAEGRGDEQVIDAAGKIVAPGLIDIHTQLREPGCEEDETIATGTASALAGGYTTIACLPETDPPIDTAASVEFVRQKAARAANCNVLVIACVSKNKEGKELAELGTLSEAGAIAFSDGLSSIQSSELLRRALEYAQMFNKPILHHPESIELSRGGVMHEGKTSLVLGLAGMPAEAEDVMTSRDIRLTEATHGRLHLLNISSAVSIELVRRTKLRGIQLTAGVCAINFTLTDEELRSFDAEFKLNPPLRSREHVDACIAGLKFGTIDIISTGHAPRASEKKMQELDLAPFGMCSLETTLPLVITKLIEPGHLDWLSALAKLTINPAKLLGLNKGTLRAGADADITIIDPTTPWKVEPRKFKSKSCNTPLAGYPLIGRASHTIVGGEVKFQREL
ncbi:dihydroorotase [Anatilimnocola sp. NA78]|uniref:dihydroorotase n=1 Tax=Anatilimnocola sp. NA78 TaxID=3415683 RepID=UPI003CE5B018